MSISGSVSLAMGPAFCRAVEQYQPEDTRLFNDPVAYELMNGDYRWMTRTAAIRRFLIGRSEAAIRGIYGSQVCRTRYIDDALITALRGGISQVVILGAGLDSRACRIAGIEKTKVFEVDLPEVVDYKRNQLEKRPDGIPANITFLAADFDMQTMESVFSRSSFDPTQPTFFIWEAVTQYITAEAVARTLTYIGNCARGSRVVFTYVLRWLIDDPLKDPEGQKMVNYLKMKNIRWTFGLEPSELVEYLKPFHLNLLEDVGKSEYETRYLQPIGRVMDITFGERICLAQK